MTNTTDQNPSQEQRLNPMNGLSQRVDGKWINLFDLHESDIDIHMIAHTIARLCRYNGQVAGFISVGMHSVRCCLRFLRSAYKQKGYLDREDFDIGLQILGHDFAEAFYGDLVRPLKNDPEMRKRYLEFEHAGEVVICRALDITYPFDPRVKEQDMHDAGLEMGENSDGERFDSERWDDIQETSDQIVFLYGWLLDRRNEGRDVGSDWPNV